MIGKQYRHANGNIYTVTALTNEDSNNDKYSTQVIHIGQNGKLWSRPLSDWDRSFTLITLKEE